MGLSAQHANTSRDIGIQSCHLCCGAATRRGSNGPKGTDEVKHVSAMVGKQLRSSRLPHSQLGTVDARKPSAGTTEQEFHCWVEGDSCRRRSGCCCCCHGCWWAECSAHACLSLLSEPMLCSSIGCSYSCLSHFLICSCFAMRPPPAGCQARVHLPGETAHMHC